MADVHFTRPNVGFGNILYVITVTGNDPFTDQHPVGIQSVRRLTFWARWFHSNAILVYKLVRFFSPESKATYATTRSTLALFSTYPAPFLADGLFIKHG